MGLHVGRCRERGGDFYGPAVNLAARVCAAGHGGQLLATENLLDAVGVDAVDLGRHLLSGIDEPVRIFQIGDGEFEPLRTATDIPTTLPATRGDLIGREEDLARIRRLLGSGRLVTVTGVGGADKTRLAVEAARRRMAGYPGGVFFVDLTGVTSEDRFEAAVAAGVGVRPELADPIGELRAVTAGPVLLVLDNCEHLIDAVADWVDRLLTSVQQVTVLATSREALEIDGERTFRVPSLAGGPNGPASVLFVERATAASDAFELDEDDVGLVESICEQLDGMPLAIELAAAWTRVLPLGELQTRLDDRFALLSGGRRRRRQRQQTLDAVIGWSFDLLDESEQQMLSRLSVFTGGFDIGDVPGATGFDEPTSLELVDSLVAKSLVEPVVRRGAHGFRLLETVRQFALMRLAESDTVEAARDRHLAHFSTALPPVSDAGFRADWDRLLREAGNASAALTWALDARPERLTPLVQRYIGSVDHPLPLSEITRMVLDRSHAGVEDPATHHALLSAAMWASFSTGLRGPMGVSEDDLTAVGAIVDRELEGVLRGEIPVTPASDHLVWYWTSRLPETVDRLLAPYPAMDDHPFMTYPLTPGRIMAEGFARGPASAARSVDRLRSEQPTLRAHGTLWTSVMSTCAAYVYGLAERIDDAASVIAEHDAVPEDAWAGMQMPIARSLVHLGRGDHQSAADELIRTIAERELGLVAGQDSTFLAMYARLALATGDAERARELIDLPLPRQGLDFLLICDTKARIDHWPADQFLRRSHEFRRRLLDSADPVERVDAMVSAHADERARWSTT